MSDEQTLKIKFRAVEGGTMQIETGYKTDKDAYLNAPVQLKDFVRKEVTRLRPSLVGSWWEVEVEARQKNTNYHYNIERILDYLDENAPEEDRKALREFLTPFDGEVEFNFAHLGPAMTQVVRVFAEDVNGAVHQASNMFMGSYETTIRSVNQYTPKKK